MERHLDATKTPGKFAAETDLIIARKRVARVDLIFVTPDDLIRQTDVNREHSPNLRFGRMRVPPTLAVESVSIGHEAHDRETKREWYAVARVPNYWILDPYARSLECLVLDGADYHVDQAGRDNDELRPSLFPGLVLRLGELWE